MDDTKETSTQNEIPNISETNDPVQFMNEFRDSEEFQSAYNDFFKGKREPQGVTWSQDEKDKAFFDHEQAKQALIRFGVDKLRINYDNRKYSKEAQEGIETYIDHVSDSENLFKGRLTQDEIRSLDNMRYSYHESAARQLVEDGIVPTSKIGRALLRLILIGRGLDTASKAMEPDKKRIQRKFGL